MFYEKWTARKRVEGKEEAAGTHNTAASSHTRQDMAEAEEADYSFPKWKGKESGGAYPVKSILGRGEINIH